jgi:hypothetical protein
MRKFVVRFRSGSMIKELIMKLDLNALRKLQSLRRMFLAASAAVFAITSAHSFADVVSARYATGVEVPVSSDGFNATGNSVDLTLNFAPAEGQDLMLVRNTGPKFIQGNFGNLVHGQIVALQFRGVTYHFVANYYGGEGRDLVLMRIRLDDLSAAARTKLNDVLMLALKKSRGEAPFNRPTSLRPEDYEKEGRVLVDMQASASTELLNQIAQLGGQVTNRSQTATTMRVWVPFTQLEAVANLPGVQFMSAARLSITHHFPH